MLRTYATPLILDVIPSKSLRWYFVFVISLSFLSIWLLSIDGYFKAIFSTLVIGVYFQGYKQIDEQVQIVWNEDNEWLIKTKYAENSAVILRSSFIRPWLTILNFKLDNKKTYSVVLFKDSIHPDQFRKLRVRLKVENKPWSHAKI